ISIVRDITERKKAEEEIIYLSYHDQLTGLYNRRFYEEELIRINKERNIPITLVMADVNGLKLTNDAFGHKAGDILLEKVSDILKRECGANEIITRIGGDEFVILLPKTDEKEAEKIVKGINVAIANEKLDNVILSISIGFAVKQNVSEDINEIFRKAEADMYRYKLTESSIMRSKTIDLIMNSLYEKSSIELIHSKRVSELCEYIATKMNFEKEHVNQIRIAGLMHDIGKIGINENIVNKAGKLNSDEWYEIMRHSEVGYQILRSVNEFSKIADYVLQHHERWNGSGYPKGLKGEEISIEARIIAVVDAYETMISDGTYRKSLSEEDAINELRKCSGMQFDPNIAKVFVEKVLDRMW
ncbi:MAG TPA: diguanylate cyclase, partial [Clostridium sp.]